MRLLRRLRAGNDAYPTFAPHNVDRKGVLFAHGLFTYPLTNRRRHRSSITVAMIIDAAISHKSSGSLPILTAISLTPSGSGSGCSTSWAGPWLLLIFSRTAMNDVYCVNRLYFKPREVTSLIRPASKSPKP